MYVTCPESLQHFEEVCGSYAIRSEKQAVEDGKALASKATGTKCTGLLLQVLVKETDKVKIRKGCLKVNKMVEAKGAHVRKAISCRANLAIKMEL